MAKLSPLAKTLIAMAKRTCGVRSDEVHGISVKQATKNLSQLALRGHLVKLTEHQGRVRYFAEQSMLDAYALDQAKAKAEAPPPATVSVHSEDKHTVVTRAHKAAWRADTPAFVPPHVKVQQCPGYKTRTQEVVLPFVHGGNQRGRM